MSRNAHPRAAWLVLVASLAFATSSPLSRLARPAHPLAVAFGRLGLAALILFLLHPRRVASSARRLSARAWARVALAGGLLAGHFALFQAGLEQTSLPAAVSLISLEPLAVVLTAWALFGIEPRRLEKIGVVVATLGALLIARGAGEGEHRLAGDALVLGAVALFGLYVAAARAIKDAIEPLAYAPLVYAVAAASLALVLPFMTPSQDALLWPLPWGSIAAIAALAAIPTVVGHTLVQAGARTLSPSMIALVCPGETLGSIAIAMAAWRKPPTIEEAIGGAVILGGALIAIRAQRDA